MADEFNTAWRKASGDQSKDVHKNARAMTKVRLQANKVKRVLSANTDIPVNMEAVVDDVPLSCHVTPSQLEHLAEHSLARALEPVHGHGRMIPEWN